MDFSPWRTRAGIALALLGAVMLFIQLRNLPGETPPSNEPRYFELKLMGKSLVRIPARAEDIAATLKAKWVIASLIPLAGGAFLLFLGTTAGVVVERFLRELIGEEKNEDP